MFSIFTAAAALTGAIGGYGGYAEDCPLPGGKVRVKNCGEGILTSSRPPQQSGG
jgi:hypothetical protein